MVVGHPPESGKIFLADGAHDEVGEDFVSMSKTRSTSHKMLILIDVDATSAITSGLCSYERRS